jgi:hypothetical protein
MHPVHAPAAAPWFIVDDVEGREIGYRAIVDSDGFTVCDPSPMGEANARLISAAPDLLAALQTIADSEEYSGDSFVCDFQTLQAVARAAIAKAEA